MSDDKHDEPAKGSKWRQWVVVALILYVLSIGPVGGMFSKAVNSGQMSEETLNVFVPVYMTVYGPLIWLATKVPFVKHTFIWYVGLFQ